MEPDRFFGERVGRNPIRSAHSLRNRPSIRALNRK
jgi:hypothetical protein